MTWKLYNLYIYCKAYLCALIQLACADVRASYELFKSCGIFTFDELLFESIVYDVFLKCHKQANASAKYQQTNPTWEAGWNFEACPQKQNAISYQIIETKIRYVIGSNTNKLTLNIQLRYEKAVHLQLCLPPVPVNHYVSVIITSRMRFIAIKNDCEVEFLNLFRFATQLKQHYITQIPRNIDRSEIYLMIL